MQEQLFSLSLARPCSTIHPPACSALATHRLRSGSGSIPTPNYLQVACGYLYCTPYRLRRRSIPLQHAQSQLRRHASISLPFVGSSDTVSLGSLHWMYRQSCPMLGSLVTAPKGVQRTTVTTLSKCFRLETVNRDGAIACLSREPPRVGPVQQWSWPWSSISDKLSSLRESNFTLRTKLP